MGNPFNRPGFRLWPSRRRARIERIEDEAEALIQELGPAAYAEARRREDEASSEGIAADWGRVALAIARRTGSPDARAEARGAEPKDHAHRPRSKVRTAQEPKPSLEARPQPFRIQFVGASSDHRTSILKEVEIRVLDVSSAIVEAANLPWPPRTIALRILDGDGREVFERHREDRR